MHFEKKTINKCKLWRVCCDNLTTSYLNCQLVSFNPFYSHHAEEEDLKKCSPEDELWQYDHEEKWFGISFEEHKIRRTGDNRILQVCNQILYNKILIVRNPRLIKTESFNSEGGGCIMVFNTPKDAVII